MKIKIVKISKRSHHFPLGLGYSLVGMVGEVSMAEREDDGAVYFELKNCQYTDEQKADGLRDGDETAILVDEYEVIE